MKKPLILFVVTCAVISANAQNNDFTSPDLDFFNIHGPVKELIISYTGLDDENRYGGPIDAWSEPGLYKFDTRGKWTNPNVYKVERNNKGQIVKLIFSEEGLEDWHYCREFEWKGNQLFSFSQYALDGEFHYLDNVISSIELFHGYTIDIIEDNIKFSGFVYDDKGNWISCKWNQKISHLIDEDTLDPDEPPTYKSGTMIREITYY